MNSVIKYVILIMILSVLAALSLGFITINDLLNGKNPMMTLILGFIPIFSIVHLLLKRITIYSIYAFLLATALIKVYYYRDLPE